MYAAIIGGMLIVLSIGGAFLIGREAGSDACQAAKDRDEHVASIATAAAASAAASAINGIKVRNVTIRQQTETKIQEVPVYRDCRNEPSVLRNINESLTGRAEPAGSGLLPRASAPGG
ncbi:MAG: hypothetical protein JWQ89_2524 [Devosia sp.]|uniref:hypothetical protein n=1 Tax=Devosia sp. TaxID=1871048 RepID=UPI002639E20F|nr:hypothetical protein [Devosia sp.]MDB5540797.1 hypothetical protein [Devosia sp.]